MVCKLCAFHWNDELHPNSELKQQYMEAAKRVLQAMVLDTFHSLPMRVWKKIYHIVGF